MPLSRDTHESMCVISQVHVDVDHRDLSPGYAPSSPQDNLMPLKCADKFPEY